MDSSLRDSELPADLSPLAWVQEELRRSLESVHKTLRRLVREGGDNRAAAFGSEAPASQPLQQASAQLHQVSGVLSLVVLLGGQLVEGRVAVTGRVGSLTSTAGLRSSARRCGWSSTGRSTSPA